MFFLSKEHLPSWVTFPDVERVEWINIIIKVFYILNLVLKKKLPKIVQFLLLPLLKLVLKTDKKYYEIVLLYIIIHDL